MSTIAYSVRANVPKICWLKATWIQNRLPIFPTEHAITVCLLSFHLQFPARIVPACGFHGRFVVNLSYNRFRDTCFSSHELVSSHLFNPAYVQISCLCWRSVGPPRVLEWNGIQPNFLAPDSLWHSTILRTACFCMFCFQLVSHERLSSTTLQKINWKIPKSRDTRGSKPRTCKESYRVLFAQTNLDKPDCGCVCRFYMIL